jgi:hypothetical protein
MLALTSMGGEPTCTAVDHIKIVVKQLSRTEATQSDEIGSWHADQRHGRSNALALRQVMFCAESYERRIHDRLLGTSIHANVIRLHRSEVPGV